MNANIPTQRLRLAEHAPRQYAAMAQLEATIDLEPGLRHLVKLRASQVNGCVFCIDMHWKDARAAGEPEERLYSLAAWAESPLYSTRERTALALCEAVTLVADGRVPDAIWDRARAVMAEPELAQLVFTIAAINAWNRLAITTRIQPRHRRLASA